MGKRVVGYWDCPSCGTKKILGTVRECPNCGKPRQAGTKFYVGDAIPLEQVVKDKEEQAYIRRQTADWVCEYCDSLNSSNVNVCSRCGAPRTSDDNIHTRHRQSHNRVVERQERQSNGYGDNLTSQESQEYGYGDNPISHSNSYGDSNDMRSRPRMGTIRSAGTRVMSKVKTLPLKPILIVAVIIIAAVILGIIVANPRQESLAIQSHEWCYEIELEEERVFSEQGWTLPAGARETGRSWNYHYSEQVLDHYITKTERTWEIVGYEQVQDGYDYIDNGDGTFNQEPRYRQEPVYDWVEREYEEPVYRNQDVFDWYYTYDVARWVPYDNIQTQGRDLNPYWGDYTLGRKQRVGNKKEHYYVYAYVSGKEGSTINRYSVSYADWRAMEDGSMVLCKIIGDNATLVRSGKSESEG